MRDYKSKEIEEAAEQVYSRLNHKWKTVENVEEESSIFNPSLLLKIPLAIFLTYLFINFTESRVASFITKELFVKELNHHINTRIRNIPKDLVDIHKHVDLQEGLSKLSTKYLFEEKDFVWWNDFYATLPKK